MTDAQYSSDTGSRGRTGRRGEPDHRARHTGDALLAPVAGGPAEWDSADAGHRAGVHARGEHQRDQFRDSLGVAGHVSALDGGQDFPSGDHQLVADRDVRVGLIGRQLHDEQHGVLVRVDEATAITYATTRATVGGTTMQYSLDLSCEQLV